MKNTANTRNLLRSERGSFDVSGQLTVNGNKVYHEGYLPPVATIYKNGLMSATDKTTISNLSSNYVSKKGDTLNGNYSLTGNAAMLGELAVQGAIFTNNFELRFANLGSATIKAVANQYSHDIIRVDNVANYGHNLLISSGGRIIIGSGESGVAVHNALGALQDTENTYICSDEGIYIFSNCQNGYASRKEFQFLSNGNFNVINGGVYENNVRVYSSNNPQKCPFGFTSGSTTDTTWGNRTGTHITEWVDDSSGAIKFRKNNPSSGKMSMLIDGTVYVNEGANEVYHAGHKPTYSDIGAAAASHNHDASNITSGTLPASRGGTGYTTLQATRSAMGLGNTIGAVPIANGGTGATTAAAAISNLGAMDLTSAQTVSGTKTFATIVLRSPSSTNYGGKLTFGDGNYAFIKEFADDALVINGGTGSNNGIFLSRGNADISGEPSTSYSSTFCPAIGGYLSGSTLYLFTMGN